MSAMWQVIQNSKKKVVLIHKIYILIVSDVGKKISLGGTQKPGMKLPLRMDTMHVKALSDSS